MDDINKIWSGARPIGSELHGQGNYAVTRKNADKKSPSSFRIGEIIQGKILDIPTKGIAKLRLPNGVFKASLHDSLIPGDELFFLVSEIEPSLVLKAHSILTGRVGVTPDPTEILRLLNLPNSEIFRSAAELLYTNESIIRRDDILSLEKNYREIFGDVRLNKLIEKLSLIRDFIFSGVVIDDVDLEKILPFYESEKLIADLIKFIDNKLEEPEIVKILNNIMDSSGLPEKSGLIKLDEDFLKLFVSSLPGSNELNELIKNFHSFFIAADYRYSIPQFADNYLLLIYAGIASGKFVIHKFKTRKKKKAASYDSFIATLLGMGFEKAWDEAKDSRALMSGISSILLKEDTSADFKILEYKIFSPGGKYLLFSSPQDIHSSKISVVL